MSSPQNFGQDSPALESLKNTWPGKIIPMADWLAYQAIQLPTKPYAIQLLEAIGQALLAGCWVCNADPDEVGCAACGQLRKLLEPPK